MSNKLTIPQSKFICFISVIIACLTPKIYKKFLGDPSTQTESLLHAIPIELFLVIIILIICYKIGFKNVSLSKPRWKKLYWIIPEIIIIIIIIITTIKKPVSEPSYLIVGKLLFLSILIGIYEELLSRGIILHIFLKFGNVKRAIIFSGIIFGMFHLSSFNGSNGVHTFQQIIETVTAGIYAGVLTLALRSLIPLIFTHTFFDFFQFVSMYFNSLDKVTVVNSVSPSLFDISCYFSSLLYLFIALVIYLFERKNIAEYTQELKSKSSEIIISNFEFYLNILVMIISIVAINIIF